MHIHFIGIGGIGVSGIAQLALKRGDKVSGSDIKETAITRKLAEQGATVFIGHKAQNVAGANSVVYSSAIREDNPEMIAARALGIGLRRRAEFLCELMAQKKVITITGAHGKTTTSSLAATLLWQAGLNPTIAIGGILRSDGDNARFGESEYFVAEADESDGTFLCYTPTYSVITNIDYEHMDFYKTYDNLLASFRTFINQTRKDGCVFYYSGDQALASLVKNSSIESIGFGYEAPAEFTPKNISMRQCHLVFTCCRNQQELGEISVELTGRHNVLNVLAVVALGIKLGLDFPKIIKALSGFKGVERRFQVKLDTPDILIVDDYAHHPTEIAATIEAAGVCGRRVGVVFQPHRYTRTKLLLEKFARSFLACDYLVITDIYAAGEEALDGISAETIVEGVRTQMRKRADYVPKDKLLDHLKGIVRTGDLVLFLGAGDITKISDEFAKSFQA